MKKLILIVVSFSISLALFAPHVNAQMIENVIVNTFTQPFSVQVQSYVFDLNWHNIECVNENDANNTQVIRFQLVGSGVSNAMGYFDTTVFLSTESHVFDLCVYVEWLQSDGSVFTDTVILDSLCLTSSQILNVQNFGHSENQPKIFPNPTTDNFFIVFDENADVSTNREARVYDLAGNLQFTRSFDDNAYVLEINTENMSKGMYIVVISANGVDVGTYKVTVR
jgi:hypothetical protein